MKKILLLVVVGLIVPSTASATVYWSPAKVAKAITTADHHWIGSPCAGRERIVWVNEYDLRADRQDEKSTSLADAWSIDCTAHVDAWQVLQQTPKIEMICHGDHCRAQYMPRPAWRAAYLCTILEHEFGHLAGLGHSPDPENVMYGMAIDQPVEPCAAAFR